MIKLFIISKPVVLFSMSITLSGCLGGTVAQQIARSIATSMTDSAVAHAMDVQEKEQDNRSDLQKVMFAAENANAQNVFPQTNFGLQSNSNLQQQIPVHQQLIAQQNAQQLNAQILQDSSPDPYTFAFANARFTELKPTTEPLPAQSNEPGIMVAHTNITLENNQLPMDDSVQENVIPANQLVQVELFNLLIGDEKAAVYNKAQMLGATSLPKQREWKLWRVATGVVKTHNTLINAKKTGADRHQATQSISKTRALNNASNSQQIIIFLIPPEFGILASGAIALVEIASPGELNIARYKIN